MTNYYVELGLSTSASIEELETQLKVLQRTWTGRAGSARFGSQGKQDAERMVQLIREASEILLVKDKRAAYDKELANAPEATQTSQSAQRQAPVNMDNIAGAAAFEDLAEQFYGSANYRQAVAVVQKAMQEGYSSVSLFRVLALCYAENNNPSGAVNVIRDMLRAFGNEPDAHLCAAQIYLQSLPGHAADAKNSINWLINAGYGNNGSVVALDIKHDIENDDMPLAENKIQDYLERNPQDQEFRQAVSYMLASYADEQADAMGGSICFLSEESLDNWLEYTDKALYLFPDKGIQKAYNINKEFKQKTFVSSNWPGLVCGVFFTLAAFNDPKTSFLGVLFLLLTVFMAYTSFVPKWMFHYYEYKQKLCGIYEAGRIINIICSFLIRLAIWAFQFAWNFMFGLMRSM